MQNDLVEREGYRVVLTPVLGLVHRLMTFVSAWALLEILKTDQGRMFVHNLPILIKATLKAYI